MWRQWADTLDMAVRGLMVGVAASAPMGPVGVLTVRRTLLKGRWYGLATGLGAAVSDIVYALMTGLGMSLVMDFVARQGAVRWLRLGSSLVLFVFGYLTCRGAAARAIPPSSGGLGTLPGNALTGFLLAAGNPLIVLLFAVLFARLDFVAQGGALVQAAGYVGLLAGEVLWWWCLTGGVDKVRERFDPSSMVWMNRTVGAVMMALALYLSLRRGGGY